MNTNQVIFKMNFANIVSKHRKPPIHGDCNTINTEKWPTKFRLNEQKFVFCQINLAILVFQRTVKNYGFDH